MRYIPMTNITRSVFMQWTTGASSNSIDILVAFWRMFRKINARTKHASDISMSFVKSFLYYGIYKWRSVKKHPFITLIVIFFCNFTASMWITFPKFDITNFLNFAYVVTNENTTSMALITVFTNCRLKFLKFDSWF